MDVARSMHLQAALSRPALAEDFDPALRFECWAAADALRIAASSADVEAGFVAGCSGSACPGPARSEAYRLGWEMGAIAARRVPVPAWMHAVNAQHDNGCLASA